MSTTYDQLVQDWKTGNRSWKPIDADDYDWYLGCVPPMRLGPTGFVMGEPYSHTAEGSPVALCIKLFADIPYAIIGSLKEWDTKVLDSIPKVLDTTDITR